MGEPGGDRERGGERAQDERRRRSSCELGVQPGLAPPGNAGCVSGLGGLVCASGVQECVVCRIGLEREL